MSKIIRDLSPLNAREDMPTVVYVLKKLIAFFLIYFVSMVAAEGIVVLLHYFLGYDVLHGEMMGAQQMTLMKYYGYLVFLAVGLLYCRVVEKRSPETLGFNKNFFDYFIGMAIALALVSASLAVLLSLGAVRAGGGSLHPDGGLITAFFFGFVIQGAMEETLCRGFLMTSLQKKGNTALAVLVSSLAFVLPHLPSLFGEGLVYGLIGTMNLLLISLIFSLLALYRKNIWIACGLHSFWNFLLFNVFGLNLSGAQAERTALLKLETDGATVLNGGAYGIEASIVTTLVLSAFLLILKKRFDRRKGA